MQKIIEERTAEIRGHGFFDFERSAYGTLELELEGVYAEHVEVVIGEMAENDMIVHHPGWTTFIQERLKLSNGRHLYRFNIPPHLPAYDGFPHPPLPAACPSEIAPFRYAEINHYYGKATVRRRVYFDDFDDDAAFFESSDGNLNKVWEFCKYSMKAPSCFGIYVDGERERQAFEGDCYINALGAYCSGGGYEIARRTLEFMIEFYPIPALEYRLITPRLVRDYMLYSGDELSLHFWQRTLPQRLCQQYLNCDGLIENPKFVDINDYRGEIPYQYFPLFQDPMQLLVDWPPNERDDYEYGAVNFISNVFYYDALNNLDLLLPGNGYDSLAKQVRQKMLALFKRADGGLADNANSDHMALHTAVMALAFDLADRHDSAKLADFIVSKGMKCSVYMAQFLLDACFKANKAQHAIDLLRSDKERSWLNMIAQGSTISMEAWSNELKPNQDWNHAWGAAPANIIPRRLAGIRPLENGFKKFIIDPQAGDVKEFVMHHPSPKGEITLEYSSGNMQFTVPEGSAAVVGNKEYQAGKHSIKNN